MSSTSYSVNSVNSTSRCADGIGRVSIHEGRRLMAIRKDKASVVRRIAEGWRPLRAQITGSKYYLDRGYLRLDWGPPESADRDRMCWYLTERGRSALAEFDAADRPPQ